MACASAGGSAQRPDVLAIGRELTMETLGVSLAGSKAPLEGVRDL